MIIVIGGPAARRAAQGAPRVADGAASGAGTPVTMAQQPEPDRRRTQRRSGGRRLVATRKPLIGGAFAITLAVSGALVALLVLDTS